VSVRVGRAYTRVAKREKAGLRLRQVSSCAGLYWWYWRMLATPWRSGKRPSDKRWTGDDESNEIEANKPDDPTTTLQHRRLHSTFQTSMLLGHVIGHSRPTNSTGCAHCAACVHAIPRHRAHNGNTSSTSCSASQYFAILCNTLQRCGRSGVRHLRGGGPLIRERPSCVWFVHHIKTERPVSWGLAPLVWFLRNQIRPYTPA
jgi:hypothetical protein